jgi:adenylate cyclase
LADGYAAAVRAVSLDDRDPYAHYALSWLSILKRQHQQALADAQRAIDLNPNLALGFWLLGVIRTYIGHFPEAIDAMLRSIRLNPHDAQAGSILGDLARAQYHQRNYAEAAALAERALRSRGPVMALATLLASLGQLGKSAEAKDIIAELKRIVPVDAERYWDIINPYADARHLAHIVEGLRKAGVAEPRRLWVGA